MLEKRRGIKYVCIVKCEDKLTSLVENTFPFNTSLHSNCEGAERKKEIIISSFYIVMVKIDAYEL